MRVLHVIESLAVGGAERVLVQLLPRLRELGIDGEVAALRPGYDLVDELEADGFVVHRLGIRNLWNLPAGAKRISSLAERRGCDLLHANLLFATLYCGLARRFLAPAIGTLTTFHNQAYAEGANRRGPTYRLRKALNGWTCRHAIDRRLAVSSAVAEHYREHLSLGEVDVVFNPVEIAAIDAASFRRPWGWPDSDPPGTVRIVLPGRLVHEKGHEDLIDAIAVLTETGLPLRVLLAGDGPGRNMLQQRIDDKGLAQTIGITGLLPHDSLMRLVAGADIVAAPSRFEGFGLTAAEGLVLRRAVVATDVGGLRDIVRHERTGLVVPPREPHQLADALIRLAADPQLRERLGIAGRVHVEANFSAGNVASRMAAIYREVAASKSR